MEKDTLPMAQSRIPTTMKNDGCIAVPSNTRRHRALAVCFTVIALYFCYSSFNAYTTVREQMIFQMESAPSMVLPHECEKNLVPMEAHIMSKCPDAKACLKELVLPTMQRVSNKVNFTLSYIGTPTANDGVECKHGAEECMGNIIELCAAHLYPEPRIYLGFVMCLTRDYSEIPDQDLVEDCALEHGIDFEKLNGCSSSDDGFGIEMLRNSVSRSRDAGVSTSCTVRLNENIYCIHDSGKWMDCPSGPGVNDLVIAIEKLYNSS